MCIRWYGQACHNAGRSLPYLDASVRHPTGRVFESVLASWARMVHGISLGRGKMIDRLRFGSILHFFFPHLNPSRLFPHSTCCASRSSQVVSRLARILFYFCFRIHVCVCGNSRARWPRHPRFPQLVFRQYREPPHSPVAIPMIEQKCCTCMYMYVHPYIHIEKCSDRMNPAFAVASRRTRALMGGSRGRQNILTGPSVACA